jgi:hypothetical protein
MTHLEFFCRDEKSVFLLKASRLYDEGKTDILDEQPKVGLWIPCSERMPPIDKKVLVTVDIQGDLAIDIADHSYGLWFFADEYYSYTEKDFKVLAWQPLPEPYREDDV